VVDGPVRDVIVCHCAACRDATGGPWAASAVGRQDLTVDDPTTLAWELAEVSELGASRGRCRACGTTVFWDAPGRETVSFAVSALSDDSGLDVAGHIWVGEDERASLVATDVPVYSRGLPAAAVIGWKT
jgi:hypothetical protein